MLYFFRAAADLEKAVAINPNHKNAHAHALLFVSRARTGSNHKGLKEYYQKNKTGNWPDPVFSFMLSQLSPSQLVQTAAKGEPKSKKYRDCEAYFYIGQYFLVTGNKEQARLAFNKCVETNAAGLLEYKTAKAELKNLK
ncbi:MAG: hypothetical protein ACLFQV_07375 [Vulcanimicrobiota bacterium]